MPDQPRPEAPGGAHPSGGEPSGFWVSVFTALGLGLLGFLIWEAVPAGVWHDDGAYLLLGRSLADGEGLRYAQVAAPRWARPPWTARNSTAVV